VCGKRFPTGILFHARSAHTHQSEGNYRRKYRRKIRRSKVGSRDSRGVCEGCREQPASEVHHLTYEHVGEEFLWELEAVCDDCHSRVHGRPP
jgi:5-methylcytosine-specific restriction endonuclease McrA